MVILFQNGCQTEIISKEKRDRLMKSCSEMSLDC